MRRGWGVSEGLADDSGFKNNSSWLLAAMLPGCLRCSMLCAVLLPLLPDRWDALGCSASFRRRGLGTLPTTCSVDYPLLFDVVPRAWFRIHASCGRPWKLSTSLVLVCSAAVRESACGRKCESEGEKKEGMGDFNSSVLSSSSSLRYAQARARRPRALAAHWVVL